ncbi:MerR family transcriptional regulator [Actinomadura harenae]|uniref:MerR family transcriptional regulator n=1 Tax=Actinomadura harenae TaxID=2483351 RepID=A0A3M2LIN9_9ACTN|nr:MerR family transcriptional regulator [Actinomadura harenae]RMI37342.1 MerR family transcriptional regulator [Actinomadura harenae]
MKSSRPERTTIGGIAGRFGLATHVLRHWEAEGLLDPARDTAGRRRYAEADATRVAVILRAKEAGLSLDTIRVLIAEPARRRTVLRAEAEALRTRIAAAQKSLRLLECALGCGHEDVTRCAHFQEVLAERGSSES